MPTINVGVFQCDIRKGDVETNLATVRSGIARLCGQKMDLVLLPEMWSSGFDYPNLAEHAKKTPDIIESLSHTAKKYDAGIAGSLPESDNAGIYNTLFFIDKSGELACRYRKAHLFSLMQEDTYFQPGHRAVVCQTSIGPVGLMICFDLRFPELCRTLALKGAKIVLVPAQWPTPRIHHWDMLLRARAIENQIFIVAANRYGADNNMVFNGHSQIVSPGGDILAISERAEAAIQAELDLSEIDELRGRFNCLNQRMCTAYEL